jgi:hypothetical protein
MWYSQNCLHFATDDAIRAHPRLAEARATKLAQLKVVHPSVYLYHRLNLTEMMAHMPLDTMGREPVESLEPVPSAAASGSAPPPGLRALVRQIPAAARLAVMTRWKGWIGNRHPAPERIRYEMPPCRVSSWPPGRSGGSGPPDLSLGSCPAAGSGSPKLRTGFDGRAPLNTMRTGSIGIPSSTNSSLRLAVEPSKSVVVRAESPVTSPSGVTEWWVSTHH